MSRDIEDIEFFLAERLAQVYEGDTALHAAAFGYDTAMPTELVGRGANIRARDRRSSLPSSRRARIPMRLPPAG